MHCSAVVGSPYIRGSPKTQGPYIRSVSHSSSDWNKLDDSGDVSGGNDYENCAARPATTETTAEATTAVATKKSSNDKANTRSNVEAHPRKVNY